jgi:curli biogenesis system outer membrane secretion channel CsgG
MRFAFAALLALGLAGTATYAYADPKPEELPHCDRPIGTAAVKEPERNWWGPLGLSNPEAIIKFFALHSGCLRMVDRGQGLQMHTQEEGLNSSGELQRGSNVGRGQVLAADYFLIPDITTANQDSGGGNVGAAFGSFLPGGIGAAVGNISVHSQNASVTLTLEDSRTTEQLYISEGKARKTDVGFGGGGGWGGWGGFGALSASGYTNTDIGKIIMQAYYNAFIDMVHHLQAQQPGEQQANAPIASQHVTRDVQLRKEASPTSPIVYTLHTGDSVYPTGARNGVWMEVDDENGNRGWMSSAYASPR